ncbi:MAG: alcohol dehydrogenase catalytic domain-containing protein, partial [Anaerotruncus massiliensis (ex Togo et al. 2019)]
MLCDGAEEPGKFVKKEFPIPEPGDRDLLLRVEMVSICGSDRLLYRGSHRLSSFPKILGHEVVGYVDRLGAAAKREYGVDVGDRVTVEPYIACNKCEYCLTGLYQAHLPHMTYGVALNCDKPPYLWGAYSQYLFVAPGSRLHRIAPEVPAEAACLSSV